MKMKGQSSSIFTTVSGLLIALLALAIMWIVLSNLFGFSTGLILKGAGKFVCNLIPVLSGHFC